MNLWHRTTRRGKRIIPHQWPSNRRAMKRARRARRAEDTTYPGERRTRELAGMLVWAVLGIKL